MASRGNTIFRRDYTGTSTENIFPEYFIPEFKEQERKGSGEEKSKRLYDVPFEEVDLFRRHTRSYIKKLGELKVIPILPRGKISKKLAFYIKDSILIENFEEWVDLSIQ